jgi:2-phospho-L-lactate guanylyltransferase
MFRHVLQVVARVPQVIGTLVISRDGRALAIAREHGARTVQESGAPELNAALMRATQVVARWRSRGILILPGDLPLISEDDVINMVEMGRSNPSVVIATDENEDGTNAMLIRPPGLIEYAYGTGSFQRHIHLAHQAGAEVKVYQSERLALDIDLPADLEAYQHSLRYNGRGLLVPDKSV